MTDKPSPPRAPVGLQARGRAFWRHVTVAYELERDELELLVEACRLLDECEALAAVLAEQGYTVTGSTGQTRVHPAVTELRSSRLALGRLLAQLGLPDEDGQAGVRSGLQARGAHGAASRWAGHTKVAELDARSRRGTA